MLSSLDVLVLLKLIAKRGQKWTQPEIASELFISQSAVSNALKMAESVKLYSPARKRVNALGLEEALGHGARYFLAAKRGGEVRGVLTAWAAPPLSNELAVSDPLPPVWPDPFGNSRGLLLEPLHPKVPQAAGRDPLLYQLLAVLDVLRADGGARANNLAKKALHQLLSQQ